MSHRIKKCFQVWNLESVNATKIPAQQCWLNQWHEFREELSFFFRPIADKSMFKSLFFFAVPEMTSPFTRLYRHKHNEICPLKAEKWINTYRHLHSACWMLHTWTYLLWHVCLTQNQDCTTQARPCRRRQWVSDQCELRRSKSPWKTYIFLLSCQGYWTLVALWLFVSDSSTYLWVCLSMCVFFLDPGSL